MGIPFLVYLPTELYYKAKELTSKEGVPIAFLIRKGLHEEIEKRRLKESKNES